MKPVKIRRLTGIPASNAACRFPPTAKNSRPIRTRETNIWIAMNTRMKMMIRGVMGPRRGSPKAIPASLFTKLTGASSESTNAKPRRAKRLPKVAMKELIPITATKKALIAPTMRPVASAARIPNQISGINAITTPESASVLATLKSSSPIRITAVRPNATMPISAMRPRLTW